MSPAGTTGNQKLPQLVLSISISPSACAHVTYQGAIENAFGEHVDYGSIVKTCSSAQLEDQRRYSPPEVVNAERAIAQGDPDRNLISTSYVEKQNHTLRMHCRRMSRLTNAFPKKFENFKAAVALHYACYNFVKFHKTIRGTHPTTGC